PHAHSHPHPHQPDLSLSTPVHSLEQDSSFGGFFDDDLGIGGNVHSVPTVWIPDAAAGGGAGAGIIHSKSAEEAPEECHQIANPPAAQIPFVQIHTTDLQQPEKSYRNVFRRRNAEIKSEAELIKSELAEAAAKERLNATPTPPTRSTSCPSVEGKAGPDGPTALLLRCPNCPFLSLCQVRLQQHLHLGNCFGTSEQQRRQCPGCPNLFYSSDALSLHLSLDHQLEDNEILALQSGKSSEAPSKTIPTNPSQLNSRIFIKSVDSLQDFPPLIPQSDICTGNILDLLEEVTESGPSPVPPPKLGQKISIKSVDVLREPALLPFDFQLQTQNNSMLEASPMEPEKPRQPKIYIRNVDILKEPMVLPSALPALGFSARIPEQVQPVDGGGLAGASSDVFQAEALLEPTCPLPGFEPSLAPLAQMCSEAFPFDSVLNGNGEGVGVGVVASGLENTRFSALDLDFSVDFVSEATPPPAPVSVLPELEQQSVALEHYLPPTVPSVQPKQKIFIKNVDILKAPQRGTLHLRTVDELNLMNRTEVEHLIVPQMGLHPLMELPAVEQQQLELELEVPPQSLGDFQASISGSWPSEDGYDLADDLEDWPWMEDAGMTLPPAAEAPQLEGLANSEAEALLVKELWDGAASGGAVPPLVPAASTLSSLPVPPLVPLATEAATEKPARIYVANNLLPPAAEPPPLAGGTSVRGRPYGAKHSGGTAAKRRSPQGSSQAGEGGKCQVEGCMFRFKNPATLEYHGKCHNGALNSSQPMVCPECGSHEFSNWNCLHTHLWRTHQIDMELYCCQLCSFKTPIYSRLVNTHAKIHSEERNYKCEQCGKGFKNTKQLKNHRRLHRTQGLGVSKAQGQEQQQEQLSPGAGAGASPVLLHRCEDCGAAFKQRKTLREHLCKQRNEQLECSVCQRVFGSKSSLRLHLRSHQERKRFRCGDCDHEASDHNAFRRHLATHKERKRYACPHCDFRAIQSTAFRVSYPIPISQKFYLYCAPLRQIHLQKRHPEQELTSIIYKCDQCSFSSINQGLLLVHQAKHDAPPTNPGQNPVPVSVPVPVPVAGAVAVPVPTPSQIKVESSLVLAHSSKGSNQSKEIGRGLADVLQAS
ncbi:hypothetical protein KR009_003875, partial [Drosophila setifemur]